MVVPALFGHAGPGLALGPVAEAALVLRRGGLGPVLEFDRLPGHPGAALEDRLPGLAYRYRLTRMAGSEIVGLGDPGPVPARLPERFQGADSGIGDLDGLDPVLGWSEQGHLPDQLLEIPRLFGRVGLGPQQLAIAGQRRLLG